MPLRVEVFREETISGRFCKRVVLANGPLFRFFVPSFRFYTLIPVFGTAVPFSVLTFRFWGPIQGTSSKLQSPESWPEPTNNLTVLRMISCHLLDRPSTDWKPESRMEVCWPHVHVQSGLACDPAHVPPPIMATKLFGPWGGKLFYLQLGASLLTIELLCLQSLKALLRSTFPL